MPERLKTYREAAAWLGISARWLEDGVQAGRLPHARFGRSVRFSQEHLDAIVRLYERKLAEPQPEPEPEITADVKAVATAQRRRAGVTGRRRREKSDHA